MAYADDFASLLPGRIAAAPYIPSGPVLASPSLSNAVPVATSAPVISAPMSVAPSIRSTVNLATQLQAAVAERDHLQQTGSGISQVQNKYARAGLTALDTIARIGGSVFAPLNALEHEIPGTAGHHDVQVHRADQRIANEQAQQGTQLQQQDQQAQIEQRQAQTIREQAQAEAIANPHKIFDASKTVQTDDGVYQIDPETGRYNIRVGDRVEKPKSIEEQAYEQALQQNGGDHLKAYAAVVGAKNTKDASLPQQYLDAISSGDSVKARLIKRVINDTQTQPKIDIHQATARPESSGTYSLAFQGDKPVMFNTKTGEVKDAPVTKQAQVPGGKMSVADQNRASLAKIALNNLDQVENIVSRRGDLLGSLGSAKTVADLIGSNDPDMVALGNEVHNFAMANAGIHGSRSFQNVQNAEQELLGHFKNGQRGIQGGIAANRANLNAIITPSAPSASAPAVGSIENGYRFKGGNPASQSSWDKVK